MRAFHPSDSAREKPVDQAAEPAGHQEDAQEVEPPVVAVARGSRTVIAAPVNAMIAKRR